uniref:NEDD8-activating enzyme E1 regulatory subunit n=1 Tax=Rhabditophanes sp. KR3021 TaxID=114890 RepID=A0AC35UCR3_9BILA
MAQDRYDRQIRIWGEDGQEVLQSITIHILGSDGLATEIAKSLFLAGVQKIVLIDDAIVTERDTQTNFFIHPSDKGTKRGEAVKSHLSELNPTGEIVYLDENPLACITKPDHPFINDASIIVVVNMNEFHLTDLSNRFYDDQTRTIILIRTNGLIGYIRHSMKEHVIMNNKNVYKNPVDLRLTNPWPELKEYIDSIKLEELDHGEHSHVPYSVILMKAFESFMAKQEKKSMLLQNSDRQNFKKHLASMKKFGDKGEDEDNFKEAEDNFAKYIINLNFPENVTRLFNDARCDYPLMADKQKVWTYVAAIKKFKIENGCLPLQGTLPDMQSDTAGYLSLLGIYKKKAEQDASRVEELRQQFLTNQGINDVTDMNLTKKICRNISYMDIQSGCRILNSDLGEYLTIVSDIQFPGEGEFDNEQNLALTWMLVQRAVDSLAYNSQFHLLPIEEQIYITKDEMLNEYRKYVNTDITAHEFEKILPLKAVAEYLRGYNVRLVAVESIVGGMGAQEIIKIATKQFTPISNSLLFDGYNHSCQTFKF